MSEAVPCSVFPSTLHIYYTTFFLKSQIGGIRFARYMGKKCPKIFMKYVQKNPQNQILFVQCDNLHWRDTCLCPADTKSYHKRILSFYYFDTLTLESARSCHKDL